jgi:DNA-binding Xre family transcriptional regulator
MVYIQEFNHEREEKEKMEREKNLKRIKNDYGLVLRWTNGDETTDTKYFLENIHTHGNYYIDDVVAIDFIKSVTVNGFRNGERVYDNYIELFNILNIEKLPTFGDVLKLNKMSGNRLSKETNTPRMTISNIACGNVNVLNSQFGFVVTICEVLGINPQDLYDYLTLHKYEKNYCKINIIGIKG